MATATITDLVTKTVYTTGTPSSTLRATPQGGILEGGNPTHYDPKNPIIIFIIQAGIVLIFTRILHFPLSKLRQPRVIAEVITGIILGPSIMGRIPGFTATIFPPASIPGFTLVANIGLVLFLFLVGLEVDLRFLTSNWRIALSVGAAGMALPFGLGAAIAYGLYHQFDDETGLAPISFGVYMLFIGVATAITAFPVLCRILTSQKLLHTPVGVIVLSAGVANDVVGWILLALCVALVNSSTSLTALWIFLVAVGYTLFLIFMVRPAFLYVLRRTGSLANGPTQTVVALTVLMVLASAFFTGVIGIHPIFGAFMIGLMAPHEGGFAIKLTEKLEDLVSVLFLPLYFVLSGLSTNLGLLDNGITWAYVFGVTAVAFFAKVAGGTLASRLNGLLWRESLTIGCLMSCKGLVELIVLNIGLQAKILNTRTFTIFVVMALVTTFATTPLTVTLYPPWYRRKLELWKAGKIDWEGNPLDSENESDGDTSLPTDSTEFTKRVLVYLRLDSLPSLFTLVTLLGGPHDRTGTAKASGPETRLSTKAPMALMSAASLHRRPLTVHALRLLELTERESSVMKVSELESYATRDPIIKAFRTFAHSQEVAVGGQIAVVPEHSFAGTLVGRGRDVDADLLVIPWSETGGISETPGLFDDTHRAGDVFANREYAALVTHVFENSEAYMNVGVWVDKSLFSQSNNDHSAPLTRQLSRTATGFSVHSIRAVSQVGIPFSSGKYNIRVVYSGTLDDLVAVRLGLQLARNDAVHLTVLDVRQPKDTSAGSVISSDHDANPDALFEQLQTRTPQDLKARVEFKTFDLSDQDTSAAMESVVDSMNEAAGDAEQIVVMGRNFVSQATMSVAAAAAQKEVFAPRTRAVIQHLRNQVGEVSVLVVQAKRDNARAGAKLERKMSRGFED